MKELQGAPCTDLVAFRSPELCHVERSPSRGGGHSLLLLQLRNELEGKWRPDKFGILRRWMNASPKHWFCQKEDAYDYAMRPGMIMRNVRRGTNVQKRTRRKQRTRSQNPARSKASVLMERFVHQVSPNDYQHNSEVFPGRGDDSENRSNMYKRRARRFLLEDEIMTLQKRLQQEVDLHLALENAVSPGSAARPQRPQDFPLRARELLEDVAALEKVVAALEEQSTALKVEIGHARKERESMKYSDRRGDSGSDCSCKQAPNQSGPAAEDVVSQGFTRQVSRSSFRSNLSKQDLEQTPSSKQESRNDHSRSSSAPRTSAKSSRPSKPSKPSKKSTASLKQASSVFKLSDGNAYVDRLPTKINRQEMKCSSSSASTSRAKSQGTAPAPALSQEIVSSGGTIITASDVTCKHSFLSAFDPHNRVQSSAALLQTVPFSIPSARYSTMGSSSASDHSGSSTAHGCLSSDAGDGGRADVDADDDNPEDGGSLSPLVMDCLPVPTSHGSTPEHRLTPTSPASAGAGDADARTRVDLFGLRCHDALATEGICSLKHFSRSILLPPETQQRSSKAWGSHASEEFYTPKTSTSGFDHLSGDSQPSSAEKRSRAYVKLSLQADDIPMSRARRNLLEKSYERKDLTTRQRLMCELMSSGLHLDAVPRGCRDKDGSHEKGQLRDYKRNPNLLSEEMVRCMVSIYWHLADPGVITRKRSSSNSSENNMPSPTSHFGHTTLSSFSSFSESSVLSFRRSPLVDLRSMDDVLGCETMSPDPYKVRGRIPWADSGLYSRAFEVSWMSVSTDQLGYAAQALYKFRLLVEQLPEVDPRLMSHSQKLAFWINLYNSLMMHAYLAYGIPRSELKYFALLQKASYNVGGHSFNAATIEYSLLRGRSPSYRPQIALLMALHKSRWSLSEEQSKYGIDYPEPQVAFSLCCGAHSSPAVRLYTARRVHKELNIAMRDYMRATVGLNGKGKFLLPKLVHTYSQDLVDDFGLLEWICQFLPPNQAGLVQECWHQRQSRFVGAGKFSILPFELDFRYLFDPSLDPAGTSN